MTSSQQWTIRQYNRGDLPPDEMESFEVQMMNDPTLAQAVELDDLLALGVTSVPFPARHGRLPNGPSFIPRWGAWAALVVVASVLAMALVQWTTQPKAWGTVAFAQLGELRGAEQHAATIEVGGSQLAILEIPALTPDVAHEVRVERDGKRVFRVATRPRAGVLTVAIAPGELPPGRYTVTASAEAMTGPAFTLDAR